MQGSAGGEGEAEARRGRGGGEEEVGAVQNVVGGDQAKEGGRETEGGASQYVVGGLLRKSEKASRVCKANTGGGGATASHGGAGRVLKILEADLKAGVT